MEVTSPTLQISRKRRFPTRLARRFSERELDICPFKAFQLGREKSYSRTNRGSSNLNRQISGSFKSGLRQSLRVLSRMAQGTPTFCQIDDKSTLDERF